MVSLGVETGLVGVVLQIVSSDLPVIRQELVFWRFDQCPVKGSATLATLSALNCTRRQRS